MKNYFNLTKKSLRILTVNNNENIGYIYLNKHSNDTWEVKSVVAEKGYGHKMYELAMSFLYPEFIIPTRDLHIEKNVYKIYKKFLEREDIDIEPINQNDPLYKDMNENNYWYNIKYRFSESKSEVFDQMEYKDIHTKGLKFFLSKYRK